MLSIINKKCSPQCQNYGHSKVFTPVKVAEKITGKSSLIKAFAHTIGNSVVWLRIWIMKVWQIIFGSKFSDIYLIKGDLSSVLLLSGYGLVFFVLVLFIYIYTIYIYYICNTYIYIYTWTIVSSRWLPMWKILQYSFHGWFTTTYFCQAAFFTPLLVYFILFFFVTHNNWYGSK